MYNIMSVKDVDALAPQLGLEKILKSLVPSNYTLSTMNAPFPEYWRNLSSVLNSTSKETVEGFLTWSVVYNTASYVNSTAVEPYIRFSKELNGEVSLHTPVC